MKRVLAVVSLVLVFAVILFATIFIKKSQTDYEEEVALHFTDVAEDAWYYPYVSDAYHREWFRGTSDKEFSPEAPLTRGEFAQVLYRYLGKPGILGFQNPFVDLSDPECKHAVIYLNKLGIISGKDATHYAPDEPITREEIFTFLYRLGGFKVHEEISPSGKFMDWQRISPWAVEAIDWAIEIGLLDGLSQSVLGPQEATDRAQAAKILCIYAKQAEYKTDTSKAERKLTLRVWQAGVDDSKRADAMKKLLNSYEKKHPGITVEYTPLPSGDGPYQKITKAIREGTAPDVLLVSAPFEATLADSGDLLPLDTLLSQSVLEDIQGGLLLDCNYDRDRNPELRDRLISVPFTASPRTLLVNKTLFQHFGISLPEEGYSYARLLFESEHLTGSRDGKVVYGYGARVSSPDLYLGMLWTKGESVIDPLSGKVAVNTYGWKEVTGLYESLYAKEITPDYQVSMDYYSMLNMFAAGSVAMMDASEHAAKFVQSQSGWEGRLHLCPYGNTDQRAAFCVGEVAVIPSASKHVVDSAELINFLLSTDSQYFFSQKTGDIPAVMSALDPDELAEDPRYTAYIPGLEDTKRMGSNAYRIYKQIRDSLRDHIEKGTDTVQYCKELSQTLSTQYID